MPSPFPGMDPFIEGQEWSDFHHRFIAALADALQALLAPDYLARIGERIYVEQAFGEPPGSILPDVAVLEAAAAGRSAAGRQHAGDAPFAIPLPMPEEVREAFLEVRRSDTRELVTVIEVLSPTNKRVGSTGHEEYLPKRRTILRSSAHLIEIDLLRGGERMPTTAPLPLADYYLLVSRAPRRPVADVWAFTLRDPFPTLPVPLAGADPDVLLDLQSVFAAVYDAARYDRSLDYRRGAVPPLGEADAAWAEALLAPLLRSRDG